MHIKLIITLITFITSVQLYASDKDAIEATYEGYRQALLKGNGEEAWKYADFHTHNYYEDACKDAISMSRKDFDRSDLMHRFMIVKLRTELTESELHEHDGKSIFVYAVDNGWISKAIVEQTDALSSIDINGHTASASLPNNPNIPVFHFIKEGEGWKIALTQSLELANQAFLQICKQNDLTEEEFILAMVTQVSKYDVDESIFDGPRKE